MTQYSRLNQPLRAAMIGGGINSAIGRVHETAMRMDHHFKLVAGCFSRSKETNLLSGITYGIDEGRVYCCAEELIKTEAAHLDAVVIATPIHTHAELIHLALDHGLRVISDKPLLSTPEEFSRLIARVTPDTTRVFSIFNYTGYPAIREMQRRIQQSEIGDIFKIMAEMPQDSYMRLKNQGNESAIQDWRLEDKGVSCVSLDLFVHLHSLIYFMCKETPLSVSAWTRSISGVSPGLVDEVDAILQYSNNLIVNAWYGKAGLGYRNGLQIRLFGTKGSLQWHQEDPEAIFISDSKGNTSKLDRITEGCLTTMEDRYNRFKAGHPSGFIEAFANYYSDVAQAIREDRLNPYTLSLGAAAEGISICQAIDHSSLTGKTIKAC